MVDSAKKKGRAFKAAAQNLAGLGMGGEWPAIGLLTPARQEGSCQHEKKARQSGHRP